VNWAAVSGICALLVSSVTSLAHLQIPHRKGIKLSVLKKAKEKVSFAS